MTYESVDIEFPLLHDLRILKGQPIAPGSPATAHKVVVVEIWATTCPNSKNRITHLTNLQHKYGHHLSLVGVSVDKTPDSVSDLLLDRSADIDYTIAYDVNGTAKQWLNQNNFTGTPIAFLVVQNRITAVADPADNDFLNAIDQAIQSHQITL